MYIACDGIVTWRKCENLQDITVFKLHTVQSSIYLCAQGASWIFGNIS